MDIGSITCGDVSGGLAVVGGNKNCFQIIYLAGSRLVENPKKTAIKNIFSLQFVQKTLSGPVMLVVNGSVKDYSEFDSDLFDFTELKINMGRVLAENIANSLETANDLIKFKLKKCQNHNKELTTLIKEMTSQQRKSIREKEKIIRELSKELCELESKEKQFKRAIESKDSLIGVLQVQLNEANNEILKKNNNDVKDKNLSLHLQIQKLREENYQMKEFLKEKDFRIDNLNETIRELNRIEEIKEYKSIENNKIDMEENSTPKINNWTRLTRKNSSNIRRVFSPNIFGDNNSTYSHRHKLSRIQSQSELGLKNKKRLQSLKKSPTKSLVSKKFTSLVKGYNTISLKCNQWY